MDGSKTVERVATLEGRAVRLVSDGTTDSTEELKAGAWVPSELSVGEVLKAPPASAELLATLPA